MTDEERARLSASAKAKAKATLAGPTVKASPSGIAKDPRAASKERAKEALAGKLQGTSIEQDPGFLRKTGNAIGRFVTGITGELPQAGDIDPKLKAAVGPGSMTPLGALLGPAMAAFGSLDTLENRDSRTGVTPPLTTALTAGADTTLLGTLNTLRGTLDAAMSVAAGEVTGDGFGEARAEAIDQRALDQEEIRAANPRTALGADLLASVGTGAAAAKGSFGLLSKLSPKAAVNVGRNWYGRILFGSGVGAGEAFTYRLNKDGNLSRATTDASLAMLGGTVLGGLFDTGKGLASIIRNIKAPDVIEEGVGRELIRMINIERQIKGLPAAKASDVAAEVAKLGPDATLMDAYPTLKQFAVHVLRNEDSAMAGDGLRAVISTRADLLEDLLSPDGTLREAFSAKAVRGPKQFSADVSDRFAKLQPRYADIYKLHEGTTFSSKQIASNIATLFGDKTRRSASQTDMIDAIQKYLSGYKAQGKKISIKSPTGGSKAGFADELTLEQVVDLKRVMQTAAGAKELKVAGTARTLALDNIALRDLSRVQGYLSDLVHSKVEELIPLDKVYGNLASLKTAYKAGTEAFTKTAADSADVTSFLMDAGKSAAAKRAFIEGAKHRIFKLLNKAQTADGIDKVLTDNREIFQRMEAMFGKDGLKAMIDDVRPQVIKLKTAEDLRKAIPRIEKPESRNTVIGETLDTATAIGGIPGVVSKAGALGALRRLMGQAVDPAEATKRRELYGGILGKMGEGASDSFRTLEGLLNRPIRPSDVGSLQRPAGAALGAAQVLNGPDARDGQLPR